MKYVVVTGAVGFIGSCMLQKLHEEGVGELVAVDDFSKTEKARNTENKSYIHKVNRTEFFSWLEMNAGQVDFIIHLGARTDTTETRWEIFQELNLNYTKEVWSACSLYQIPLIYASSAATYGAGEFGYVDSHAVVEKLRPLNLYGISKNEFDKWALEQDDEDEKTPPFWAGLKFFNVYGPNEYHKGRMASVVFHAYRQICETGRVRLFRSHRPDFKDGQQLRDFVYVKDLVKVIRFLMRYQPACGLYNVGTGHARSFYDLAANTFKAMDREVDIEFIDTPMDIRDKYQYFTEADMGKLHHAGYSEPFHTLEEGITDYVRNYLIPDMVW
ncbi:MAG: ADP-glyceromanno-heptose 6-epimerase [Bacteroidales bacterium]|nr:ADP-glyceromanno-heptose 6-epimerase [Bacteroidales bacterium]